LVDVLMLMSDVRKIQELGFRVLDYYASSVLFECGEWT
jgi:hypothetical protein